MVQKYKTSHLRKKKETKFLLWDLKKKKNEGPRLKHMSYNSTKQEVIDLINGKYSMVKITQCAIGP